MCVTTYTREQLISVNNNTPRPSSAVRSSISDCVLTVSHHQQSQKRRKTRRRHRAGRGSRRTISVIGNRPHDVHIHQTQSHQCHLVSFQPVNNLEHNKTCRLYRGGKDSRHQITSMTVDTSQHQEASHSFHLVTLPKVKLANATYVSQ